MIALALLLATQQPSWSAFAGDFDRYARADSVVGASAAMVENGRISQQHFFGYANASTLQRVDASTVFHWASITKTLNGVAILQLAERGLVSLDDPVTRWVPELRLLHNPFGSTDAITLRMVLGHSAGFRGGTWPYARGRPWEPFEPTRWEQLVAMMPYQEVLFAPDSRYGYSNPGYVYTARVLEAVTGDPWQSWIYKNIWLPLGIHQSFFGRSPRAQAHARSHNYVLTRDSAARAERLVDQGAEFDPGITIPNGGWNAPVEDVARWMMFLAGPNNPTVLPRELLEQMWRGRHAVSGYDAGADSMGLSFFVYHRGGGERLIGHTGHQAGFRSFFLLNPRTTRGIVAVFNTANEARPEESQRGWENLMATAQRLLRQP